MKFVYLKHSCSDVINKIATAHAHKALLSFRFMFKRYLFRVRSVFKPISDSHRRLISSKLLANQDKAAHLTRRLGKDFPTATTSQSLFAP